jgi:hypothetical protein
MQRAIEKLRENPSQLGDPVSLRVEMADSEPSDQILTEELRGRLGSQSFEVR